MDAEMMQAFDHNFWNYYVNYFRDSSCYEWFPRFKGLAREIWRLAESHDMDYDIYGQIANPKVQDILDVAKLCYEYGETRLREEMMDWARLVKTGQRYKVRESSREIHFLRNRFYYVDVE